MQLPIKTVLFTSEHMEKQNKIFSSAAANSMENVYELEENIDSEKRMRQSQAVKLPKQTVWTAPFAIVIVLLCLILILHLIILCFIVVNTVTSCLSSTTTGSTAESITPLNFTEWFDAIASKVNTNVTQSLPNFNEWSDDVVNKVNANITQSLPNFNEWSDDVVNKVNANVTQSLPKWSDDVVNKVNANVTQSLPNFNKWSDGVTHNTFRLLQNHTNFTQLDHQILQTTTDSAQKLMSMVNTLSALQDTSTSTARVTNNILLVVQKLMQLHNGSTGLPTSCKEIKERHPLSLSGVYALANTSTTYIAYCNMDTLCGSEEGWTRLAYLDMSDATQNCPSGLQYFSSSGLRTCGKKNTEGVSCDSVQFPSVW